MKQFRTLLIAALVILPLLALTYYYLFFLPGQHKYDNQWESVYRNQQGKIETERTPKAELKQRHLSLPPKESPPSPYKKEQIPRWRQKLHRELLSSFPPSTKVVFKVNRRMENPEKKLQGVYYQVTINYFRPQGRSSFTALVKEDSGKLVRTWNRTIHEDYSGKRKIRLTPTGTLK